MLKTISFLFYLAFAVLLAGCAGSDTSTNSNTPTTASTPTAAPDSSNEKIGVPECDDFIAKYDDCVSNKVPEVARAQFRASIEQWRKSWRDMAANPEAKASLPQICKTTMEQARKSVASFKCDF